MSTAEADIDLELFHGYELAPGSYDEVFSSPGVVRPAWKTFLKAISGLSRKEYVHRWEQAQRILRQNSLAYPEPGSTWTQHRPWELDGLPLIIPAEEWRSIETALIQRATLLDLVVRDLFSEQKLVRDGILPAGALYQHPGFRLPFCRKGELASTRMLHMYAVDLARARDGRWWVLADRTESASGAGFALENRIAMSRLLPDVSKHGVVERLAPYFIAVKEQLAQLANKQADEARVILLSQAAGSINYFEDAFLARYLGYPLAEAGDLAVRCNKLYLKSLAGLSPVDVLLRRPNSEYIDPLEFTDAGSQGTAGLLQAARSGNVAIANAPGSGLVESPIFRSFLPRLAEKLLGESLRMPSVATWWCGDEDVLDYVLGRLDSLIVQPAYRRRGEPLAQISRFAEMPRGELADLIRAAPASFVAQERIIRSGAPSWAGDQLQPSYIALRAYAVAHGDSYTVMPGGLARVSTALTPLEMSLLEGERSKDVWVLADAPVEPISLLSAPDEPLDIRRGGVDLSSRAAEQFFWLGRNSVRAESLAKLLRAASRRLTSDEQVDHIPELPFLLRLLAEHGQIEPGYVVDEIRKQLPAIERQLPKSAFDDGPPRALRATVNSLTSLAATVRERMSLDMWRIVRQMSEDFRPAPGRDSFLDLLDKLEILLTQLAAFAGEIAESMTRTYTWRFLDLGRRMERALSYSQLIRGMLAGGGAREPEALESLLEILDSIMTYRSRYGSRYQLATVLDLLMCDETNPRSIASQLCECAVHMENLETDVQGQNSSAGSELVSSIVSKIRDTDIVRVSDDFDADHSEPLYEFFDAIDSMLPELSDTVSHQYFFHSGTIQRLTGFENPRESSPTPDGRLRLSHF